MKRELKFFRGWAWVLAAGLWAGQEASAQTARKAARAEAPAPILSVQDFGWIEIEVMVETDRELDTALPPFRRGAEMNTRTLGGMKVLGQYEFASTNYFMVQLDGQDSKVSFRDLRFEDRVRIDQPFRQLYVDLAAKVQTRLILAAGGVIWPNASEAIGPDEVASLARVADPRALLTMANRALSERDPGQAVILLRAGAQAGDPACMVALSRLLSRGEGTPRDVPGAIRQLFYAEDLNYAPAGEVIQAQRVPRDQMQAIQEQRRQELAVQTESLRKRAEAFAARNVAERAPTPPRPFR